MSGLWRHARARLLALLRAPGSLALLLFAGLATLAWFPGSATRGDLWDGVGVTQTGMEPSALEPVAALMGMVLTAWLAGWLVAGRPAVSRSGAWRVTHPALPVSPRMRALGEAAVVVLLVLVARTPGFFLGRFAEVWPPLPMPSAEGLPYALVFGPWWLFDAALLAPLVVAFSAPAMATRGAWVRLVAVTALAFAARQLGWLALPWLAPGVLVLLLGLALAGWRPTARGGATAGEGRWRGPLSRPAGPPGRQLGRDLWREPLRRGRTRLAAVALFLVVAVGLLIAVELPEDLETLVVGLTVAVPITLVTTPVLGSGLAFAGILHPGAHPPGALPRALAALPVPRAVLLRGAFVHGAVAGLVAWLVLLALVVLHTWQTTGAWGLVDWQGDTVGWVLLPPGLLVLATGGVTTCAVAGDRRGALIGVVGLLLFLAIGGPALSYCDPGNSYSLALAVAAAVVVPVVFTLPGLLPALRHLRARA